MGQLIEVKEHPLLEAYRNHRKAFSQWSVLYGVGAPIFLISNVTTSKFFSENPDQQIYLIFFFLSAALQVMSSLVFKNIIWYMYLGETQKGFKDKKTYRIANYLYRHLWVEWIFDGPTVIMLSVATINILLGVIDTILV